MSPGLITSTPISEANNQFLPVMGFFHVFPPRRVSPPTSCPKNRETHIVQLCFLEPFVSFQNYVFFKRDSRRLINFRGWPFLLAKCFFFVFICWFLFYTDILPTNARNEYLLHQTSSNFVSLLPALLASLLCHVGQ